MAKFPDISLISLRGGMNDQDPPHIIPDDQCVLAKNVDFFQATLGEKRKGCTPMALTGSGFEAEEGMVFLGAHIPQGGAVGSSVFWGIAATEDTSFTIAYKTVLSDWVQVVPKDDLDPGFPEILNINSQSIHGKFFLAYKSDVDRMHVWDGTSLRRTGLAAPTGTLTVTQDASSGTFTDDRTYRIRVTEQDGDAKTLRRSEPSAEITVTPDGDKDGLNISTSTIVFPDENETHWELEASDGDGNFYVISTLPLATTDFLDTIQPATDYAISGSLSEDIGEYALIPSFKYITADQDRLIFANALEDTEKGSRLAWTPVWKDPGLSNDERIPVNTDNSMDLDWMDGGDITGMSSPINGSFYVFKLNKIYKVQRTGNPDDAYDAFLMTQGRGAISGSIVNGVDEFGKGCVYFLDPSAGPCRIGSGGLQYMQNIRGTWKKVNTHANRVVCHGIFYPDRQQLKWWVSIDGADSPNLIIVNQVNEIRSTSDGTERGWSIFDGGSARAFCSAVLPREEVDLLEGQIALYYRPFAGFYGDGFYIQQLDIGETDNTEPFYADILTRPYMIAGVLNWWGGMAAGLLAAPLADENVRMNISFVRDFGLEANSISTDFVPEGEETVVIKRFDDLRMAHATAVQFRFWEGVL